VPLPAQIETVCKRVGGPLDVDHCKYARPPLVPAGVKRAREETAGPFFMIGRRGTAELTCTRRSSHA